MSLDRFGPATREWFDRTFSAPTPAQTGAWFAIGRRCRVAREDRGAARGAAVRGLATLARHAAPPRRPPFAGTAGAGVLDIVSLLHLYEDESREWAARHRGAVVELHAYALPDRPDEAAVRHELLAGLHRFVPEARAARAVEERWMVRRGCPAFAPGSFADRPTVDGPEPDVVLAGDFVRLPIPTALMERAATAGFMAANALVVRRGLAPEPIASVPPRGLLAW